MAHKFKSSALSPRFQALWKRCLLPAATMNAAPVYTDLVHHYAEPGRCYHTLPHVFHCLHEFDQAATHIDNPDAVELALWFHDAVFVPGARDNEQRSVNFLTEWAGTAISAAFVKRVGALILATTHRHPPKEGDESYVADIDLSTFGVNWPAFLRDTLRVRKEQPEIPDDVYYASHARFLHMLLARPRIFYTDFFLGRYEERAKRNIQRLLATARYPTEPFTGDYIHSH